MGYNASVLSIGTASYPALGGLLTALGWQFVFLLPVFAVPLAVVVLLKLNNPEPSIKTGLKVYFANVLVITSYSIHYTKLYEFTVFAFVKIREIFNIGMTEWEIGAKKAFDSYNFV